MKLTAAARLVLNRSPRFQKEAFLLLLTLVPNPNHIGFLQVDKRLLVSLPNYHPWQLSYLVFSSLLELHHQSRKHSRTNEGQLTCLNVLVDFFSYRSRSGSKLCRPTLIR